MSTTSIWRGCAFAPWTFLNNLPPHPCLYYCNWNWATIIRETLRKQHSTAANGQVWAKTLSSGAHSPSLSCGGEGECRKGQGGPGDSTLSQRPRLELPARPHLGSSLLPRQVTYMFVLTLELRRHSPVLTTEPDLECMNYTRKKPTWQDHFDEH